MFAYWICAVSQQRLIVWWGSLGHRCQNWTIGANNNQIMQNSIIHRKRARWLKADGQKRYRREGECVRWWWVMWKKKKRLTTCTKGCAWFLHSSLVYNYLGKSWLQRRFACSTKWTKTSSLPRPHGVHHLSTQKRMRGFAIMAWCGFQDTKACCACEEGRPDSKQSHEGRESHVTCTHLVPQSSQLLLMAMKTATS